MDKFELCRLCALKYNNLLPIYGEEGIRLSIEKKIKKFLNLELSEINSLPSAICMKCCSQLEAFDEFFENTKRAQATLRLIFSQNDNRGLNCALSQEVQRLKDPSNQNERENFNIENISEQHINNDSNCPLLESCHSETTPLTGESSSQSKPSLMENLASRRSCSDYSSEVNGDERKKEWDLKTWLCCDCSEELQSAEELRHHHESVHKQEPKYMCIYCSKLFHLYNAFIAHLKRHKSSIKYSCNDCGKAFSNKKLLDAHTLTHSNVRPYSCQECGKCFRQHSSLYIHSRCHLPEDIKNKFTCDLCNKRFSTKPNLVTHMRIHSGIKNFTCDQCGKSFIQKGNLDAHLLTHSHEKPYFCEICNKRFKTGMQLRKHHSVHTGAKPHQCDICGRTFREKGTLREHHRIHTGAMPFTCEFCGKSFRFKGILTTHRRQHTGERPYSCLECQHHFTNWPNYNKHMKRRHGINTSRSTRTLRDITEGGEDCRNSEQISSHVFQEISTRTEGYQPQATLSPYMYNIYNLPQVPIDPLSI